MIRGAIAFGLVLKIPNDPKKFPEREVIVTTTLAVVIITTLFFGTFMKFAQKIFLPANDKEDIEIIENPNKSLNIQQANDSGSDPDENNAQGANMSKASRKTSRFVDENK